MSQLKECASLLDTIHRSINHLKMGSSFGRSGGGGGLATIPGSLSKGDDTPNTSRHVSRHTPFSSLYSPFSAVYGYRKKVT